jgi:hypothetical protein
VTTSSITNFTIWGDWIWDSAMRRQHVRCLNHGAVFMENQSLLSQTVHCTWFFESTLLRPLLSLPANKQKPI